ncbi:MAG: NADH-quinone oxidoreductase subunit I [bacterium]
MKILNKKLITLSSRAPKGRGDRNILRLLRCLRHILRLLIIPKEEGSRRCEGGYATRNDIFGGIIEITRGMLTVLKHILRPPITLEYPEQKPKLNSRFHGRPALLVNPDGSEICGGCTGCVKVCPCGDLIHVETDPNNKQKVSKFTIDIGRCIFCGNCTEICPKGALIMTDEFELADYSREALVFDKDRLLLSVEESNKWREKREKDI